MDWANGRLNVNRDNQLHARGISQRAWQPPSFRQNRFAVLFCASHMLSSIILTLMKIKVKDSDSFHSAKGLSNAGEVAKPQAVAPPKQWQSLNGALIIVILLFVLFCALALLRSLGNKDEEESVTQQPQQNTKREPAAIADQAEYRELTQGDVDDLKARGIDPTPYIGKRWPVAKNPKQPKLTPEDIDYLRKQGLDPNTFRYADQREQSQVNGIAYIGNFMGMTNFPISSDYIISITPTSIKFQFNGQTFACSGHYAVVLNTPRKHRNPAFGFGTPEKAKMVIMDDFGGEAMPLPGATVWEKSDGFIDVEAMGKEWIYSGSYTIQQ